LHTSATRPLRRPRWSGRRHTLRRMESMIVKGFSRDAEVADGGHESPHAVSDAIDSRLQQPTEQRSQQTRVLIADCQPLFRGGLRLLFGKIAGTTIVGEAGTGKELLDCLGSLKPDLVVCDSLLPDCNGFELAQQIRRHFPNVRIMFIASALEPQMVRAALKAGASAFLGKTSEPAELELALRAIGKGQFYLSPCASNPALELRSRERAENSMIFSRRQREVLRLIGKGKCTKEIAELMDVSPKTVETHRARLMHALGLHGSNALTHYAVRIGLAAGD